ncbi:MAG: hypothetical protein A4E62_01662 [Syntrophorhabdus sp. PtaU1.Bin002]|nr:MAG: hypothetical protein A4E58_00819 [Syntrophorhabdus sp. PtaB.Bin006]OPY70066.1 MAG: hypothetical protein A4E62_01662 [Syntrophorhabdus sp. PtaU1.Bin002]
MEICERCIVPSSFPHVTFEDGLCTFCRNHDESPKLAKESLGSKTLLQRLKSKPSRSKYDCVVALSGGKDSSYVLYFTVRKLGLNPLAVFFDNGFVTHFATDNIRNICKALGVDVVVRKATAYRAKLLKEHLAISGFTGNQFYACFNCENNLRTSVINEAVDRGIPFILWGSTTFEDPFTTFLNTTSGSWREARKANTVHLLDTLKRLFIEPLFQPIKSGNRLSFYYHHLLSRYYMVRDNFAMHTPEGWRNLSPYLNVSFDGKGPEVIYFFDYIQYNPPQMVATLQQEIGWTAPKNKEARVDCKLGCFGNYHHLKRTGITKDGFTFSVLVRHGLLSRADALKKEETVKDGLAEECDRVRQEIISRC